MPFDPKTHVTEFHATSIPANAKVAMQLAYYPIGLSGPFYEIKSITATTYYHPGQTMSVEVAEQCCRLPNWTVTMVENDVLQTILGFLTGAIGQTVSKAITPIPIDLPKQVSRL